MQIFAGGGREGWEYKDEHILRKIIALLNLKFRYNKI